MSLADGYVPREKDVRIADIETYWPHCFLVHHLGADAPLSTRFGYLYLGEAIISAYGDTLSQRAICERLVYPANPQLVQSCMTVVRDQAPHSQEADFINDSGATVRYRSVLLPLRDNVTEDIAYILGGMRWKLSL